MSPQKNPSPALSLNRPQPAPLPSSNLPHWCPSACLPGTALNRVSPAEQKASPAGLQGQLSPWHLHLQLRAAGGQPHVGLLYCGHKGHEGLLQRAQRMPPRLRQLDHILAQSSPGPGLLRGLLWCTEKRTAGHKGPQGRKGWVGLCLVLETVEDACPQS